MKTACGNRIRGLLAEYGEIVPAGAEKLLKVLPILLDEQNHGLSPIIKGSLNKELEQLAGRSNKKTCANLLKFF